jgi:nitroreductase
VAAFDAYAKYLTFFKDAPLVIVAMAKQAPSFLERISKNIGVPLSGGSASPEALSIAMAIQNIQLAAHVMGLGSCCMTGPLLAADEIRSILDVRPPFELTAIIPVGGYDTAAAAPERKKIMLISEIIE